MTAMMISFHTTTITHHHLRLQLVLSFFIIILLRLLMVVDAQLTQFPTTSRSLQPNVPTTSIPTISDPYDVTPMPSISPAPSFRFPTLVVADGSTTTTQIPTLTTTSSSSTSTSSSSTAPSSMRETSSNIPTTPTTTTSTTSTTPTTNDNLPTIPPTISFQPTYSEKCWVCGSDQEYYVKNPNAIITIGSSSSSSLEFTCGEIEQGGRSGLISPEDCPIFTQAVVQSTACNCQVRQVVVEITNLPTNMPSSIAPTTLLPTLSLAPSTTPTISMAPTYDEKCIICPIEGTSIGNATATIVIVESLPPFNCQQVEQAGKQGFISPTDCPIYINAIANSQDCTCESSTTTTTTNMPTNAPAAAAAVVTNAPSRPSIENDNNNNNDDVNSRTVETSNADTTITTTTTSRILHQTLWLVVVGMPLLLLLLV